MDWLMERSRTPPKENEKIMMDFYSRFLTSLREIPVPTIAAINGPAIGAGMCLSLGCDIRITVKNAKLGFTFVGLDRKSLHDCFILAKLSPVIQLTILVWLVM